MATLVWTRHKLEIGALAVLLLCVVVGCEVEKRNQLAAPELSPQPPPTDPTKATPPPIVIAFERTADWDLPQSIPEPEVELPVAEIVAVAPDLASMQVVPVLVDTTADTASEINQALADADHGDDEITAESEVPSGSIQFLDTTVRPGELVQTTWTAGEALHGAQIPTPVLVAHGINPGPTLCVTAAVHGDELNGIEAVRRLMYALNPGKLTGTVVGVPIVNLQGFQRHSRYLSDRRDLNRFFPGNPRGSSAARMAFSFFNDVIRHCDGLVDLHTGSFHRTNLPQLRADLQDADVLALTKGFGSTVILHSSGGEGTLRRAAVNAGIPAVTLEAGEPLRLQNDAVEHTVKALFTLLDTMNMYDKRSLWGNPEPTYYSSVWIRADQGGILLSSVKLGRKVKRGDALGTVTDPISNEQVTISAPYAGRVIGMALNQFVMPGFATFHIATEAEIEEMPDSENFHNDGLDVAISESLGTDESE